jgi:hypothetical protein
MLATVGLIAAALAAPVAAGGIDGPDVPAQFVDGNPTCGDLGFDNEVKFDSPNSTDGTYTDPISGFSVDLDFNDTPEGETVDFSNASDPVTAVFVKGSSGGNLYDYSASPVTEDDGLHAPIAGGSETWAQVSHISFCFDEPEESESQAESESPEGSVGGGTGTPAGSVPDTSTSMPGVGGPLATLLFGAILVASLGALAYANVAAARRRG